MSNKEITAFIVHYDNEIIVCRLPDAEAGKLFKSLFPYAKESIRPDFENSPALAMAFDILGLAIDRNKELYEKKCKKNKENIGKRWNQNNTTVYDGIPTNTNDTNNKSKSKTINKSKTKNINNNITIGAEPEAQPRPSVIKLLLNDNTEQEIYQEDVDNWAALYPAVDIMQELRKMKGWLEANPSNRKTRRGVKRFITNWLSREQDKGRRVQQTPTGTQPVSTNRFCDFEQRQRGPEFYDGLVDHFIQKANRKE